MKPWLKLLTALAAIFVVIILVPVLRHYQLRAATNAYIARLEEEGEPMELSQVLPSSVPPKENDANTFQEAAALLDADTTLLSTNEPTSGMKIVAPGKAIAGWRQLNVPGMYGTNLWQEIGDAIARNDKVFTLLQQITEKPHLDFQIQYSRGTAGMDFKQLHLPEIRKAEMWLATAAEYHLHAGDTAAAVNDTRAMLDLAQALKDERFEISELVRIAIVQIAVAVTWDILQYPTVTDAQLALLQSDWEKLDFIKSGENSLATERVTDLITLEKWRASPSRFASDIGFDSSASPRIFMWRYWWSYPDELRCLKGEEVLMTSLRMAETNDSFETAIAYQTNQLNDLGLTNENDNYLSLQPDLHSMLSDDLEAERGFSRAVMVAEAAKRLASTATALKRYQCKHGNYPANLNALVPDFLPAVPLDPVDGKPLRYHLEGKGTYSLYSVGPNGKDDGANPAVEGATKSQGTAWLSTHALDWVWPQPVAVGVK